MLRKYTLLAPIILGLLIIATRFTHAADFTVDLFDGDPGYDDSDSNLGDGQCTVVTGGCSLRAAIEEALATSGTDIITFTAGGTISLGSPLPTLTGRISIDGWSAGGSGYTGPPLVQVRDAATLGSSGIPFGFILNGNQHHIFGLSITGFDEAAIFIEGSRNTVYGNYIGVTPAGDSAEANGSGIQLRGTNSIENTIGGIAVADRNVISGNENAAVNIDGPDATNTNDWDFSQHNRVIGNYIGTNADGDSALANGNGVTINNARYVTVGQANAGNLISGNDDYGISAAGGGTRAISIRGNIIGLNAAQNATIPNGDNGIQFISNQWNRIEGNTISGNNGSGIFILGNGVKTSVCNNFIGTNSTLDPGLGNGGNGVLVAADDAGVDGNYIGFSPVFGTISPPACNTGNTIAYNTANGVQVQDNARLVAIRGNRIFGNGGLGIMLNDTLTGGPGPNEFVEPPVLSNAGVDGSTVVFDVTLQQQAGMPMTSRQFEVHFYANDAVCDPTNPATVEGETYLGSININVNAAGFGESLGVSFPGAFALGTSITATASGRAIAPPPATGNNWRSTSPFSTCIELAAGTDLRAQKSASLDTVTVNQPLTYTINVRNLGTNPATNVTLQDNLPAGVIVTSVIPDSSTFPIAPYCNIVLGDVSCVLGDLNPNDIEVVIINVNAPPATGVIANRVSITSDQPDIRVGNNQASVFTIVGPASPTPTETDVPVPTDEISPTPLSTTFIDLSATPTAAFTMTATATTEPTVTATASPTPTQTPIPTNTATHTATATVTQTATATPSSTMTHTATLPPTATHTMTATLVPTSTLTLTPDLTATQIQIEEAGVEMEKVVEVVGAAGAAADQIAYNVTVNNQSAQPLTNVILVEQLLQGIELIDVDAGAPECTKTLNSISCVLGTLDSGASARVNFLVQISGGADPLLNRTIVRSSELPDLELDEPYIVKLASPAFLQADGIVTWTIRLLNPGSESAANVVVTDRIPPGFDILSVTSTLGNPITQNQQVTLRLAQLAPVQAVTMTIRAQLVDNRPASPTITNEACLQTAQRPTARCVRATILRVDQLPNTGESRWSWLRWLALITLISGAAWVVRRQFSARRA